MKLSYNWLKSYIDLEMTPSELCRVLTGIGLEVGGMEEVESIRGGWRDWSSVRCSPVRLIPTAII